MVNFTHYLVDINPFNKNKQSKRFELKEQRKHEDSKKIKQEWNKKK